MVLCSHVPLHWLNMVICSHVLIGSHCPALAQYSNVFSCAQSAPVLAQYGNLFSCAYWPALA